MAGFCHELFLYKLSIYAVSVCFIEWGRVVRHDCLATIFLKWLAFPAGLDFLGKYGRGESEGFLFSTSYHPAYALIFPLSVTRVEDSGRPAAIEFVETGSSNTTNVEKMSASRNYPSSSDAITADGEVKKTRDF